jgi:hypothetical protein
MLVEKGCKGKDSKWSPYLDMLPDIEFFCDWEQNEHDACQDEALIKWSNEFKVEVELQ